MPPFEAAGITPQALARALWKQRVCWAVLWLLATAAVLAAVWSLPRRYKTEAVLAIDPARPPGRGTGVPSDAELRAQLQLARLRVFQRERLLDLLRQTWPELVAKWKPADAQRETEALRGRFTVLTVPDSRGPLVAVRVAFEASDPARGAAVTNRVAAELAGEFERLGQAAPAANQHGDLNAAWARLSECHAALAAFEREHGAGPEDREKDALLRLAALRAELAANAQALRRAHSEAARLEQVLSQAPAPASAFARSNTSRESPAAEPPSLRQLRERLALLRARYKDAHPDVRRALDELARAQALSGPEVRVPDRTGGADAPPEESLRQHLRAELDQARRRAWELEQESLRLRAEVASQQEALTAAGDLRRQHQALKRECEIAEAAYRAQASRPVADRRASASVRLVVLEQALPQGKPARPNRPLLAILGALLALLPCGAIAAGREMGLRPLLALLGLAPPVNGRDAQPAVMIAAAGRVNGGCFPQAG
ncbi:MAG: hypothetical protein NZ554_00205 [Bryobacteraceae bacterium]|nr:hypothetical protein [Bryobacteraceae bacterium]